MKTEDRMKRAAIMFVKGDLSRDGYNILIQRTVKDAIRSWMPAIDLNTHPRGPIGHVENYGSNDEIRTLRDFLHFPECYGEEAQTVPASLSFEAYARLQEQIRKRGGSPL